MIDLHLHLDGSLSKEDFIYLANRQGVNLGEKFPENIVVNKDCTSLEEYLQRFALPCSLLQDYESLKYVTTSLIKRLYSLNYIYVEIRFAPQLHTLKGMNEVEVVQAVLDGLKEGLNETPGFDANVILCCMRQTSYEINVKTIEAAIKLNDKKIVAIDLAGPEAFLPTRDYKQLFDIANSHNLNVIIHAGEACGNESIMEAIDIGAKRIGHGVHLSFDEASLKKVKNRIYFEFCPTSNLQTKSLSNYHDVPLRQFMDNDILVTINSDNMTVSDTDVIQEFKHMVSTFSLNKEEAFKLLNNSIDASFIQESEKEEKRKALLNKFDTFCDKINCK